MSEGSPILLNMGAEVATASGLDSTKSAIVGSNNGQFASVLKSAMSPTVENSTNNSVESNILDVNPLLLNEISSAENLISGQPAEPHELLLDGKLLPSNEQQLAWQSILAEYDSTDPETPKLVVATGDENGYQLDELTSDDLAGMLQNEEPLSAAINGKVDITDATEQQDTVSKQINLAQVLPDEKELHNTLSTTNSPVQNKAGQTESTDLAGEHVAGIESLKLQNTDKTKIAQDGQAQLYAQQLKQDQAATEQNLESLNVVKPDIHKDAQFKSELNNMIENTDAKLLQGVNNSSSSSTSNSLNSGAMAYSAISGLSNSSGATPLSSAPVVANMTIPPQNPAWGEVVGDKVHWMVAQNINEAKIRLNPPELGMLEIRVLMGNDQQTSITFSSPHSQVRDALETAVPRLREMFNDNGLSLGDVDVSQHSMTGGEQSGQEEKSASGTGSPGNAIVAENIDTGSPVKNVATMGTGMLDLYA